MEIETNRYIRIVFVFLACIVIALAGASCRTSQSSPTSPSNVAAPPAPPAATGSLSVRINPNPVPFSGQPVTDAAGCAGVPNTWFYEQVLTETGGANVIVFERVDLFDGKQVNKTGVTIDVVARSTTTIRSRWCSASSATHTAQTNFTARDAATGRTFAQDGPIVNLMKK